MTDVTRGRRWENEGATDARGRALVTDATVHTLGGMISCALRTYTEYVRYINVVHSLRLRCDLVCDRTD